MTTTSSSKFLHLSPEFNLDPVEEAEAIGGTAQQALGMQLMLSARRRVAAVDAGDTMMGDSTSRFDAIAKRIGFELLTVYSFTRKANEYEKNEYAEKVTVYRHPQSGAILSMESYRGESVNSAKMYFTISPNATTDKDRVAAVWAHRFGGAWECVSNPNWRMHLLDRELPADALFVGNVDVRECLASLHAAVLSLNPVERPIGDRFNISEAVGCSQDYMDTDHIPWNRRVSVLDAIRNRRVFDLIDNVAYFGMQ